MIKESLIKAINDQINAELYSAYLYFSMASYFDGKNLKGMAAWMKLQAAEEMTHAQKFYNYINERGGHVILDKIDTPPSKWKNPLDVFENAYQHECKVTALINDLVELAEKEKDYASKAFLQWFVTEQVEEEATASEIVENLKMIKDDTAALFMYDKELGNRQNSSSKE